MEFFLLLLVAVIAVWLFVPELIRNYEVNSPINTISDFHKEMVALAVSTDNFKTGRYNYSPPGERNPEPYVRHGTFDSSDNKGDDEFIPYPSDRNSNLMETRRNQITALLLIFALATGITILIPSFRWVIPLHISALVLLSGYMCLTMLLPFITRRLR
ncbi:MAG: hypothetical protein JXA49_10910 [Actinobacteria bacterium]|nr:hypothetical protein [Actinomycetota bacterium]